LTVYVIGELYLKWLEILAVSARWWKLCVNKLQSGFQQHLKTDLEFKNNFQNKQFGSTAMVFVFQLNYAYNLEQILVQIDFSCFFISF
jgi:hypothetical protein